MITITDAAVAKVKEIAEAEGLTPTIRMGVKGGGCAGFSYDLGMEDDSKITDTDEIFEKDGVRVVVDVMSLQYLDGTEIDYSEGLIQSGFKFNNPNSKGSCGCGSSFNA